MPFFLLEISLKLFDYLERKGKLWVIPILFLAVIILFILSFRW